MGYYMQRSLAEIEKEFINIMVSDSVNSQQEKGIKLAKLMAEMEHTWDNCRMWDSPENKKSEQAKLYEKISNARKF